MEVQLGFRVVRGPDWEWGDQDGGEGHVGTVVEVGEPTVSDGGRAVVVQWDSGQRCRYKCGVEGKYDLRGFDSAPAGLFDDEGVYVCIGCGLRDIEPGFSWVCCQCSSYFLCTTCYMTGKHNKQHCFYCFVDERHWSVLPQRKGSCLTEVKGIFTGATVKGGIDSPLGDLGGIGKVLAVRSSKDGKNLRDVVEVEWINFGSKKTICRVGHQGKVDVLCITPSKLGVYYLDHLPVLTGQPLDSSSHSSVICSGDLVEVELDVNVFRMMQEGHGGWSDDMAKVRGQIGFVHHIRDSGDLLVKYPSCNWWIDPSAVVKLSVPVFRDGDEVRVTDDWKKAMKAQKSIGTEWTDDTLDVLGQKGQVDGTDFFGVASVIIDRKRWMFNRLCLELTGVRNKNDADCAASDLRDDPSVSSKLHSLLAKSDPDVLAHAAQLGDEHVIREVLKDSPNEVNRIVNCKAPIHYAAQAGSVAVVKSLLEFQADVNILDDMSQSALHFALLCLKIRTSGELIECLLDAGADPNVQNVAGETPLMIASRNGCFAAVKVLANYPKCDFNITNLDGATALFAAIFSQNIQSVKLLLDGGADPSQSSNIDSETVTPLHYAAKNGFTGAVEESVEHFPDLINLKEEEEKTPLHLAIANNHFLLASYLMEKPNCDINAKDKSGCTPLHLAISEGNTYLVEQLVGYGADLNIKEESGCTPLNALVFIEISGVSVTFQPLSNRTPELLKVREILSIDDVEVYAVMACLLIQEGADMNSLGIMGLTSSQTLAIGETFNPSVIKTIRTFADKYAGTGCYHGSLKQSSSANATTGTDQKKASSSTVNLCKLCEEKPVNVMFHPCKHLVLCELCAERATKCFKCKSPIARKEKLLIQLDQN